MKNFRLNLIKRQLDDLKSLLFEVQKSNSFYKEKFSKIGSIDEIKSLDDFQKLIPFTTKDELSQDQNQYPPFGSNLTYKISKYTRFHQTSGSTGAPIRWLDTPEDWQSMLESWKQVFKAASCEKGDRVFFAFSFGPFLGFWTAFEAAQQLELLCIPGGGLSSSGRLNTISQTQAKVLCCTPTYAIHLGEAHNMNDHKINPNSIEKIIVAGEPGGSIPSVKARIRNLWPNATVFDHHGMTEVGPVTFPCTSIENTLRIFEENYFPEILDPQSLQPVDFGETGELVLTTLKRVGSPLIRYRTGDLVKSCSRHDWQENYLGLEGGIIGRADDMIIVRGVNIYPSAVESIVRNFNEVTEYKVIVDESEAMTQISLQIEDSCNNQTEKNDLKNNIESALRRQFNLRVPVDIAPPGSLPRFEMKAKRWEKQTKS